MKMLWIHDHPFYKVQNDYYSQTGVNYNTFKRFLEFVDCITVVGRKKIVDSNIKTSKLIKCSGERVNFHLLQNYKSPKDLVSNSKLLEKELEVHIQNADFCNILLPSFIGLKAVEICKKNSKPYMIQVIGCAWDAMWYHGSTSGKLLAAPFFKYNKKAIKEASHVAYITNEYLQAKYPTNGKRGNLISNIIIEEVDNEVLKRRKKQNENIDFNKRLVIGMVGSLDVNYKGHEVAIKAISEIKNHISNVVLQLVGPGEKERWGNLVEELKLEKNIEFLGTLPSGDKMNEWFDSLDMYIQPSLAEGYGRAVVEAMSRGLIVISSNVGGLAESVNTDFQHDKKDYKHLAALAIKGTDKKVLNKQSEINFEKSKMFSWMKVNERRKKFYKEFINDTKLAGESNDI